jgi:uncharacterized repeat protein (TIGR01451 family)
MNDVRTLTSKIAIGLAAVLPSFAHAQQPPFMGGLQGERTTPPLLMQPRLQRDGTTTGMQEWARQANRAVRERLPMPVFAKVSVAGQTKINFYDSKANPVAVDSGSIVGLRSRFRYVFALQNLAPRPDKTFFGSMEVVLGPWLPPNVSPPDAPVAVMINEADVMALGHGNMVTKIVVLENPNTASPVLGSPSEPLVYDVPNAETAIAEAEKRGRIFMIIRIGNRDLDKRDLVGLAAEQSLFLPTKSGVEAAKAGSKLTMSHFTLAAGGLDIGDEGDIEQASYTTGGKKMPKGYSAPPIGGCDGCGKSGCADCGKKHSWGGGRGYGHPSAGYGMGGPMQAWPGYVPMPMTPLPPKFTPFYDRYDDEWVCDGGDRKPKVGLDNFGRMINLDPGDTVGVYRDNDGRKRFTESNLACVYSPRYVEVRVVQGVESYERWLNAQRMRQYDYKLAVHNVKGALVGEHAEGAEGVDGRLRASGLVANAWSGSFTEVRVLEGLEQAFGHHVDIQSQFSLWLKNTEQFFVKRHVEFAKTMTRVQYPVMVSSGQGHGQVLSSEGPAEIRKVDIKPGRPARLVLEKTVNKPAAQPGDTVTFILRYTNTGDEPMSSVAVIDSLPGRLEYVQGTAKSSADSIFTAEDNEVGSSTLRWELKAPLKGKQTGLVEFQARLR